MFNIPSQPFNISLTPKEHMMKKTIAKSFPKQWFPHTHLLHIKYIMTVQRGFFFRQRQILTYLSLASCENCQNISFWKHDFMIKFKLDSTKYDYL